MPTYTYVGESAREYPFPPITRVLTPGDEVDFEREQEVPADGRFKPAEPSPAKTAVKPTKAPKAAKASDTVEE